MMNRTTIANKPFAFTATTVPLSMVMASTAAVAAPTLDSTNAGIVTDITTNGSTTTWTTGTSYTDVNLRDASIDAGETWAINQPTADSVFLGRVIDNVPSAIRGTLNSNANVFLMNDAGITFFDSASVNVGALVATTASDVAVNGNEYTFSNMADGSTVANAGDITVSEGGFAVLAAPNVENSGNIIARLGEVQLASANNMTVDLDGTNTITFTTENVNWGAFGVTNSGNITAELGNVTISTQVASATVDGVINLDGVIDITDPDNLLVTNNDAHMITVDANDADLNLTGVEFRIGNDTTTSQVNGLRIDVEGDLSVTDQNIINARTNTGDIDIRQESIDFTVGGNVIATNNAAEIAIIDSNIDVYDTLSDHEANGTFFGTTEVAVESTDIELLSQNGVRIVLDSDYNLEVFDIGDDVIEGGSGDIDLEANNITFNDTNDTISTTTGDIDIVLTGDGTGSTNVIGGLETDGGAITVDGASEGDNQNVDIDHITVNSTDTATVDVVTDGFVDIEDITVTVNNTSTGVGAGETLDVGATVNVTSNTSTVDLNIVDIDVDSTITGDIDNNADVTVTSALNVSAQDTVTIATVDVDASSIADAVGDSANFTTTADANVTSQNASVDATNISADARTASDSVGNNTTQDVSADISLASGTTTTVINSVSTNAQNVVGTDVGTNSSVQSASNVNTNSVGDTTLNLVDVDSETVITGNVDTGSTIAAVADASLEATQGAVDVTTLNIDADVTVGGTVGTGAVVTTQGDADVDAQDAITVATSTIDVNSTVGAVADGGTVDTDGTFDADSTAGTIDITTVTVDVDGAVGGDIGANATVETTGTLGTLTAPGDITITTATVDVDGTVAGDVGASSDYDVIAQVDVIGESDILIDTLTVTADSNVGGTVDETADANVTALVDVSTDDNLTINDLDVTATSTGGSDTSATAFAELEGVVTLADALVSAFTDGDNVNANAWLDIQKHDNSPDASDHNLNDANIQVLAEAGNATTTGTPEALATFSIDGQNANGAGGILSNINTNIVVQATAHNVDGTDVQTVVIGQTELDNFANAEGFGQAHAIPPGDGTSGTGSGEAPGGGGTGGGNGDGGIFPPDFDDGGGAGGGAGGGTGGTGGGGGGTGGGDGSLADVLNGFDENDTGGPGAEGDLAGLEPAAGGEAEDEFCKYVNAEKYEFLCGGGDEEGGSII